MKQALAPYFDIAGHGLWTGNQALVALLGLCPLLAVSHSATNSLTLGLTTTITLILSNSLISGLRRWITHDIRLPLFVLIIATLVTLVDLSLHTWFYDLHKSLGIFIPLIVTNCAILARSEAFASRHDIGKALADGFFTGLGFTLALVLLGGFREIMGTGKIFSGAEHLFGSAGAGWTLAIIPDYPGFLLAVLPPGAFLGLGLLVALKNLIDSRRQAISDTGPSSPAIQPKTGPELKSDQSITFTPSGKSFGTPS